MNLNDQLDSILDQIGSVLPESILIVGSILLLIIGLIKSGELLNKILYLIILLTALLVNLQVSQRGVLLMDALILSDRSIYFGGLFILISIVLVIFKRDKKHSTEFHFFILAMLVGSLFIMKANSLLMIYLAIELVSLSSYVLTNFSFKKAGFEAGIKYLLFGAMSSAFMLFGLGLIYGTTEIFELSGLAVNQFDSLLSQVGFLMMLVGIFFKISLAPLHLWVPATYQSAPTDAVAFMSIVPKLASLVLLERIFSLGLFAESHWIYQLTLSLGILTIIIGTLGAFSQTNARRMVSFGAVAHTGFLLPLVLLGTSSSQEAFWLYSIVYAFMNLAVFYLLDGYERIGVVNLSNYSKSSKEVLLGSVFTIVLTSLVGLPPLAGFTAKFFLFTSLWESYRIMGDQLILTYLIITVLATAGSLFYYLQIPKQIFLTKETSVQSINFKFPTKIVATFFSIVLLLLFFAPKLVKVLQHWLNNTHE